MATPTEAHIEMARRLLALDPTDAGTARDPASATQRVYAALFVALAPIVGAAGVRALFARSLRLNRAQFRSLNVMLGTAADHADKEMPELAHQVVSCLSKLDRAVASEIATGLFATFFALLSTFIGERLVQQLVRAAFPMMDELDSEVTE